MTSYIVIAALWGFSNFMGFDFGPQSTTTVAPGSETYYLLVAGTTDTLTTPGGDKIKLAGH